MSLEIRNNKFKKRKGLGSVITTLIILIASVVLGAGVVFFGGSMFQTNTNNEEIKVSNAHIWIASNNGTTSTAAFVVQNVGSKPVAINSIAVRGVSVPMSSWYYNTADATAANIVRELRPDFSLDAVDVTGGAPEETFIHATGPISISQGQAVIVYAANPGNIQMLDNGQAFNLNIQAGKAAGTLSSVSVMLG